ncbi:MAG: metal-sensing transcriptional repressor [Clostridia bacterium]|nr:metal-sensing transcriptional repressor [Clostridia bacterium]
MSCCENKKLTPRDDAAKKQLITRINRISGQLNGIKQMITDDRYCDDILIQLAAVDKSIKSLASVILDDHLKSCISTRILNGDTEAVEEIVDLFRRFN